MIKIIKEPNGHLYDMKSKSQITYKHLGSLIRSEYVEVEAVDQDKNDCTKQVLLRTAFFDTLPFKYSDKLELFIPIELLYEIIENGGAEAYINKKNRYFI